MPCFSRLQCTSGTTRSAQGRTSVFAGRRSTSGTSQTLRKHRKTAKICEKSLRRRFANAPSEQNSLFALPDATRSRFWLSRHVPDRSWAPLEASRDALGDPPGAPGTRRGPPEMLPRRLLDAPGTLLGALGRPERVPGVILSRLWVAGELSLIWLPTKAPTFVWLDLA